MMRLLVFIALGFSVLNGADYYVTTGGSDSNDGSIGLPWLTVQKAANTMVAGDTVTVSTGTYAEEVSETTNGSSGSRIIYKTNGDVTIGGFTISGDYVTVNGFTMSGTGVTGYDGVFEISGDYVTIDSCVIVGLGADLYGVHCETPTAVGMTITNSTFGDCNYPHISIEGSYHTISDNLFTGSTGWDAIRLVSSNSTVSGNRLIDFVGSAETYAITHGDFIQVFTDNGEVAHSNLVENNILVNTYYMQICNADDESLGNAYGWIWRNNIFIGPSGQANLYAPEWGWYNNLFFRNAADVGTVLMLKGTSLRNYATDTIIRNNVFYECGSPTSQYQGWWSIDGSVTGTDADYNAVIGSGAGTTKIGLSQANGFNGTDPQILNVSSLETILASEDTEYRLSQQFVDDIIAVVGWAVTSPMIGSGDVIGSFTTDYLGVTRGAEWDLGPLEYTPATPTVRKSLTNRSGSAMGVFP